MDLLTYLKTHGSPAVHTLAARVGSNYVYLRQIAYGHRRPSPDFAKRLVAASTEIPKPAKRARLTLAKLRPDVYG